MDTKVVVRNRGKRKRKITPMQRLERRIKKHFDKKVFIGDIPINDSEYMLLIEYFKYKCKFISGTGASINDDPVFATALVQIGIRYYDSGFWPHVAKTLGVKKINTTLQATIGSTFCTTLSLHNKLLLNQSERVNNILMHGFVSDNYANEMFEFLFKYYNLDLERDLDRNNKEMMDNFIDVIQKNDNTGRTYLLVKHTADAIRMNPKGSKIRLRRLLRMIDKCFWEQITPINPVSRLSVLFIKWQENSSEFQIQFNKYHTGSAYNNRKKSYSTPYLKCNLDWISFNLVLPSQFLSFDFEGDITWLIVYGTIAKSVNAVVYPAVSGYKTESQSVQINRADIFHEFFVELYCNDKRVRYFKIKSDCIRFFDTDGDFVNMDKGSFKGKAFSFTRFNEPPVSEALTDIESLGDLIKSYFDFQYGDIVRLPDGKAISINKKMEEGLLYRYTLPACYAMYEDIKVPVYFSPPSLLMKIKEDKSKGTLIDINGVRNRLFDYGTTVIDLNDRSNETGYIINLQDYGCNRNGIYTVCVNVPGDKTNRSWQFALISHIEYEFEDAPYIFKSKGTIKFNDELNLQPKDMYLEKNADENSYNFPIKPDIDYLKFNYCADIVDLELLFEIPVFKWKVKNGHWKIHKPADIWHNDFPSFIYLKYPKDKIRIFFEEELDFDESLDEEKSESSSNQTMAYVKSVSTDIFECDMSRFKSWFGREKAVRSIYIDLQNPWMEFVKVITKSMVHSHFIQYDQVSGKMVGKLKIIGFSNYFVDIIACKDNHKVTVKLPVINGSFEVKCSLWSGFYKVIVYENDIDDMGFSFDDYLPIYEFYQDIINPYDLSGKSIELQNVMKQVVDSEQKYFSCRYVIDILKKCSNSDENTYYGSILVNNDAVDCKVRVQFVDPDNLQTASISFFDGYDYVEFLYDAYKMAIVMDEEKGLSRAVRYRRYDPLYVDEYCYTVQFVNESPKLSPLGVRRNS